MALGAPGMRVLRGVEDDKAFQRGLNNVTTARALLTLLEAIAKGRAVDEAASERDGGDPRAPDVQRRHPGRPAARASRRAQDRSDHPDPARCSNRVRPASVYPRRPGSWPGRSEEGSRADGRHHEGGVPRAQAFRPAGVAAADHAADQWGRHDRAAPQRTDPRRQQQPARARAAARRPARREAQAAGVRHRDRADAGGGEGAPARAAARRRQQEADPPRGARGHGRGRARQMVGRSVCRAGQGGPRLRPRRHRLQGRRRRLCARGHDAGGAQDSAGARRHLPVGGRRGRGAVQHAVARPDALGQDGLRVRAERGRLDHQGRGGEGAVRQHLDRRQGRRRGSS